MKLLQASGIVATQTYFRDNEINFAPQSFLTLCYQTYQTLPQSNPIHMYCKKIHKNTQLLKIAH